MPGRPEGQFHAHMDVCCIDIQACAHILSLPQAEQPRNMPDQFNEELGKRIRAAREGKLTQAALGAKVGLSRTAITNIECGRQRLLVDQLVQIASAIGVRPTDLLPSSEAGANPQNGTPTIGEMPTVRRWLATVHKTARRDRS